MMGAGGQARLPQRVDSDSVSPQGDLSTAFWLTYSCRARVSLPMDGSTRWKQAVLLAETAVLSVTSSAAFIEHLLFARVVLKVLPRSHSSSLGPGDRKAQRH